MFQIAKGWLAVVAKEHFEPNLWHLNDVERALGAPAFDEMDNQKFSEIELSRIESALAELKAFFWSPLPGTLRKKIRLLRCALRT